MKKTRMILTPKFTSHQLEVINSLVDKIAGSPSEVVSRIVMMWMKENLEYINTVKDRN